MVRRVLSRATWPRLAGEQAIARGFDVLCAGLVVRRVTPPDGPSAGPAGLKVLPGWRTGWLLQLGCSRPGCAPSAAPTVQEGSTTSMSTACRSCGRQKGRDECNTGLQMWPPGSCCWRSQIFQTAERGAATSRYTRCSFRRRGDRAADRRWPRDVRGFRAQSRQWAGCCCSWQPADFADCPSPGAEGLVGLEARGESAERRLHRTAACPHIPTRTPATHMRAGPCTIHPCNSAQVAC